jgi:hypothetical protein
MYKVVITSIALSVFSFSIAQACFLSGERTSGMNKICFYNCVSGTKAITISAVSLCPLSISYEKYENNTNTHPIEEAKNICIPQESRILSLGCKGVLPNSIVYLPVSLNIN